MLSLITPRLLLAGGANLIGCVAFGVVQPQLSLYLTESLKYSQMEVGVGQFMVTLGYMVRRCKLDPGLKALGFKGST